jgi:leucyl aminopeptidase (aminopeptidase T)
MSDSLSAEELTDLVVKAFAPKSTDRALAVLVDLPSNPDEDTGEWRDRRQLAVSWVALLRASGLKLDVSLFLYRSVSHDNADLPLATWPWENDSPLPDSVEELKGRPEKDFGTVFKHHTIIIALTQFSATAPLRVAARRARFRAASMPTFSAAMIPALRLDLAKVDQLARQMSQILDAAEEARIEFETAEGTHLELTLDLRHRNAHASSGILHEPGAVGNLPSGEAYIVPYEGERSVDPSRSSGLLPVQFDDEVVVYRIERNRAVAVETDGSGLPNATREAAYLQAEPAYGNLAELGLGILGHFGMRPTGNRLLDEKLGLHIAFGRSDHLGGRIGPEDFQRPEAVVHVDRVYIRETQPQVQVRRLDLLMSDGRHLPLIRDLAYTDFLQRFDATQHLAEETIYQGFTALLISCLDLTAKDELLVIADESFERYLKAFLRLISDHRFATSLVWIAESQQLALAGWAAEAEKPVSLPATLQAAISQSTALITCLNGRLDTNPFRKAIIHNYRRPECRFAHIPGFSAAILQAAINSPFRQIMDDCELFAWALGEATKAELVSYDSTGKSYSLHLALGGWENEPLMSPGVLAPGSWGNVPPGETFCCPYETSVTGKICINGSIPNRVLTAGEEIVISFARGKIAGWQAHPDSPADRLFRAEKAKAAGHDSNWNTFAELGIGLNPAITELTGNGLFDEKSRGSVHVAIGDNSLFGHDTIAQIHADLVTRRPTLILDDRHQVIVRGEIQYAELRAWREEAERAEHLLQYDAPFSIKHRKVATLGGRLYRCLTKGRRLGHVRMADDLAGAALAQLVQQIAAERRYPEDVIRDHPRCAGIDTRRLLGILYHYRALIIHDYQSGQAVEDEDS